MENDEFSKKSAIVLEIANMQPDQLAEAVRIPGQDSIPDIAPFADASVINGMAYLKSKLPAASSSLAQDQLPSISRLQKKQWLDLEGIVSDPLKVLDHVQSGTVNKSQVQTIQAVYPEIYQEMAYKVREELGRLFTEKKQLPYARRVAIAKFLGEPVDSTMTQNSMMTIMKANGGATSEQAQQGQPKGNGKLSGPALTQINKVNDMFKTPAQAEQAKKLKA